MYERIDPSLLPPVLRNLTKVMGVGPALDLVQKLGGGPLYIPHNLHDSHPIVVAVGEEAARKLVDAFGGQPMNLPKADKALIQLKHLAVQRMLLAEESSKLIAREFGYCTRRIQQLREEMNLHKPTNTDLFSEER